MSEDSVTLILNELQKLRSEIHESEEKRQASFYKEITQLRKEFSEGLDRLEDITRVDIQNIQSECIRRSDVFLKSKNFFDSPHLSQEEWMNTKVGKFTLLIFSSALLTYLLETLKKFWGTAK